MSLYLKYRPNDFESIVGQEQVKDILKAEVDKNKIAHSYLFFGPRGTGKTSTARIFAKAINCLSDKNKPCNQCENCKLINDGKTLDFVEIDAASNTQVDKIREEIIDKAIYPPTTLKKKVYIIDEVHMLSKSAFNALLKIMEEPPEYLVFILATTEIHKVPETIISRCEVFNFKRIELDKIIERLKYICKKENISYTEEGLKLIAKISDGGLRDAIKYLEQVSIIGEINPENVSKFLGIAPERLIEDFLNLIKEKDINKIYHFIDNLQANGIDLSNFIKDTLLYLNENLSTDLENNLYLANLLDKVYQNLKNFPSPSLAYKTILGIELKGNLEVKSDNSPKIKNEIGGNIQMKSDEKDKSNKTSGNPTGNPALNNPENPAQNPAQNPANPVLNNPANPDLNNPANPVLNNSHQVSSESSSDSSSLNPASNPVNPAGNPVNPENNKNEIGGNIQMKSVEKNTSDKSGNPVSNNPANPDSDLKNKILKKLDNPIVKGIIKNFGHIDYVDGKIIVTIISQTNYTILNQADKKKDLEQAIAKLYPNTAVEIVYQSKEDYFSQKLLA